jgi:hypothetical protein
MAWGGTVVAMEMSLTGCIDSPRQLQASDGRHAVSGANGQMYVPMGPFKPVGRARPVRAHGKGISWLRHDGVTAPFVPDGPMDSPHFLAYVEQVLAPTLKKDQIVGQCFHHEVEGVEEAIEARGTRVAFLPAYSPDRIHSASASIN